MAPTARLLFAALVSALSCVEPNPDFRLTESDAGASTATGVDTEDPSGTGTSSSTGGAAIFGDGERDASDERDDGAPDDDCLDRGADSGPPSCGAARGGA